MVVRKFIRKKENTLEFEDVVFVRQEIRWTEGPLWFKWMNDKELERYMDNLRTQPIGELL